jgi:16S rRNA (cytidine1402-2'-O)-methyltransferase
LASNGLAERRASVARELTKQHEEIRRGTVAELATYYGDNPARGEVVIILEGGTAVRAPDEGAALVRAREMRSAGATSKDIVAVLMEEFGLARNRAYRITQEEDR